MDNEDGKLLVQAAINARCIVLKWSSKNGIANIRLSCICRFADLIKKEGQHLFPDGPEWIVTQQDAFRRSFIISYPVLLPLPQSNQCLFISLHLYKLQQQPQNLDHVRVQQ